MMREVLSKEIYSTRSIRLFFIRFLDQLSALLSAGLEMRECLSLLETQFSGNYGKQISKLKRGIEKGHLFSEVMEQDSFYPEMLIGVIQAGEMTGTMSEVLSEMSLHYQKEFENREKIKNALMYPILLVIVLTATVIFLLTFVLPTFVELFSYADELLPASTQMLLRFSRWISGVGKYFFIAVPIAYLLYRILCMREHLQLKRDKSKFKMPFGNLRMEYFLAYFGSNLSMLLSHGVPLLESLTLLQNMTKNTFIKQEIALIYTDVERGADLHQAMKNRKFFPNTFTSIIRIGEETGRLPILLDGASNYYQGEFSRKIQRQIKMLEPAMIIILAVVVGFVVLSIAIPMFDLINFMNY